MSANESATISAVSAAGEVFSQYGGVRVAREVIGRGGDLVDFYRALQPNVGADARALDRASGLSLTDRDAREYSLSRWIATDLLRQSAHKREFPDRFDRNTEEDRKLLMRERGSKCPEMDVSGDRVPWSVLMRDYNAAQAPVSTNVGTEYTTDALRAHLPLAALGAKVFPLPAQAGSFKVPSITGDVTTVSVVSETGTASEGQPATGLIDLAPRRITGYVEVSRQAIFQGGKELDRILARVLFGKVRASIDDNACNGDGTAGAPVGVRNVAGIGSVVGGTNGANLAWSHLADLVYGPCSNNVDELASGWLLNPGTRRYLTKTQRATGLPFMWEGGEKPLMNARAGISTLVPGNLSKGTSSGNCSSIVYSADWSNLLIPIYGAPELTADPYTKASEALVRIVVNAYVAVGVVQTAAFSKMDDALTP